MTITQSEREYINLIRNGNYDEVYIFGAGKYGKQLLIWCQNNGISITAFCVTNMENNQVLINGIEVKAFDNIVPSSKKALFLIGAKDGDEISELLKKSNVGDFLLFPNWLTEYDDISRLRFESPIIEVTPIIGCSVNCRYCPQALLLRKYYEKNKKRQSKMTVKDFELYLSKLPIDTIIDFSGFVEPFLNDESIDMMEFTRDSGRKMTLFTTLRNVDEIIAKRIVQLPFDMVVLHLPDIDGFSNIPITDEYKKSLQILIEAKRIDGFSFVTSFNCHGEVHSDIKTIVEGKIRLTGKMMDRAGNLRDEDEVLSTETINGAIKCRRSKYLNHNVLLPDGTLVLCCNDYGLKHIIGNLKESSYEQIMSSDELQKIYKKMLYSEQDELLCRKCIYADKVVE